MTIEYRTILFSLCAAMVLSITPFTSHAVPITYDITAGNAPGFSASWLHKATYQMGNSGYYTSGKAISVSGSLTLDRDNLAGTSGQLTGSGWTIDFMGASSGTQTFVGGQTDLLSLDYSLSYGRYASAGTFYFANKDFNGGAISNGPNYITDDILYLWGNNWVNQTGAGDKLSFKETQGYALGLDLYGRGRPANVPEPGTAALLAIGLLGITSRRRMKSA